MLFELAELTRNTEPSTFSQLFPCCNPVPDHHANQVLQIREASWATETLASAWSRDPNGQRNLSEQTIGRLSRMIEPPSASTVVPVESNASEFVCIPVQAQEKFHRE